MQNKLIGLMRKKAQASKSQLLSAAQPKRYLDARQKQQVGRGNTILITGASSGLGEEMARVFAKLGYNLAICARRTDCLEKLTTELVSLYPDIRVEYQALDVGDYDAVFAVFNHFVERFDSIEKIVINAGIGDSRRIGQGYFEHNRRTADINFVGALAQCEAAMSIFRAQNSGHLVVVSSMSAMRGLPKHLTTYAATKAGLAHLAEGIRADMLLTNLPITVSTIYPGYIRTAINEGSKKLPFEVDTQAGTRAIVAAIEAGVSEACVPSMPWSLVSQAMKHLPLQVMSKLS